MLCEVNFQHGLSIIPYDSVTTFDIKSTSCQAALVKPSVVMGSADKSGYLTSAT